MFFVFGGGAVSRGQLAEFPLILNGVAAPRIKYILCVWGLYSGIYWWGHGEAFGGDSQNVEA